jgi:hypothetical protein
MSNSGGGNFLLVPGPKGIVHFLHQGFAATTHQQGGPTILGFIQGNFGSSPFKVLGRPADAVTPVDQGRSATRGEATPAMCPTLVAMFGAQDGDAFAALPGEVDTLEDGPNHLFVHPRIFTQADGSKSVRAKELAWALIKEHVSEGLTTVETEQERANLREEQENVQVLLAFLWALEQSLLNHITLSDMPESSHLNHQCELIMKKIRAPVRPAADNSLDTASGLATATHSLMLSMQKTETARTKERAEDKSAKSLLRNLTPKQRGLFTCEKRWLCRTSWCHA